MMNVEQIVTSVVLPSIVSIGVALYNNHRQKRLEFNYDFRKHILNRRKEAYEKIEEILNSFKTMYYPDGKAMQEFYLAFENSPNPLHIFHESVNNAIKAKLWLSVEMSQALTYLNQTVLVQQKELQEKGFSFEALTEIGIRENKRMLNFHSAIFSIYFHDMARLDDIDHYRKYKQKEIDQLIEEVNKFAEEDSNKE